MSQTLNLSWGIRRDKIEILSKITNAFTKG